MPEEIGGDPQEPGARIVASGVIGPPTPERQRERLDGQVLGDFAPDPAAQETERRAEVPFEELPEPFRLVLAGSDDVRVGGDLQHGSPSSTPMLPGRARSVPGPGIHVRPETIRYDGPDQGDCLCSTTSSARLRPMPPGSASPATCGVRVRSGGSSSSGGTWSWSVGGSWTSAAGSAHTSADSATSRPTPTDSTCPPNAWPRPACPTWSPPRRRPSRSRT